MIASTAGQAIEQDLSTSNHWSLPCIDQNGRAVATVQCFDRWSTTSSSWAGPSDRLGSAFDLRNGRARPEDMEESKAIDDDDLGVKALEDGMFFAHETVKSNARCKNRQNSFDMALCNTPDEAWSSDIG